MYGERKGAYRVLMGKPEGKRPLGRPSHSWEYNTKIRATIRPHFSGHVSFSRFKLPSGRNF
jgi:hypothetical protein